ncbi:hypothetical protein Tco_0654662 [Tanacetum coccineum]|uniref:E3 ubiquitin-protein ligase RNF123/RKP TPR repeat domain-containing protein n=1 Tax=Tanacetum coccineum TaxID=301880 RepID=A0ABQ4X3U7_9ASTR
MSLTSIMPRSNLIDVKDVAELEHLSSLQELKRKVLTRADELMMMNNASALFGSTLNNNTPTQGLNVLQGLQRQRLNVMQGLQGPNVLSSQGLNVFDNARKYYNGQYFFDPALTMNASLQDQGGGVMHNNVMTPRSTDVVAFLNRLFNTLSWAMTEFSVSIREMQEKMPEEMQCYEFCTYEIPEAFLSRVDTNLRRLASKAVFVLNHLTSVADPEFFDL